MQGRRDVIVNATENEGNYNFDVATIWDDTPGQERLGRPGGAGLKDIGKFTPERWTVEQVLTGFLNGGFRIEGKSPPASLFRSGLEASAAQPDIIIRL